MKHILLYADADKLKKIAFIILTKDRENGKTSWQGVFLSLRHNYDKFHIFFVTLILWENYIIHGVHCTVQYCAVYGVLESTS